MNKPRIWITRKLSDATLERAQKDYDVVVNLEDQPGTKEEIISASFEFDAIVPCHSEVFSSDVVSKFGPRLKIIANHSVGVDHCDLAALNEKNILVTNTPDVLSDATAEIAMLLMLGAARHAVLGDEIVRSGNWADHIITQKHKYFVGGGSYDWYWLICPEGKTIGPLGENTDYFRESWQ